LRGIPSADVEHERRVAIYDLLEDNAFEVVGHQRGPYRLKLSIVDKRLVFDIEDCDAGSAPSSGWRWRRSGAWSRTIS
jgi:uncharacterized protein (UPF0262 family)